MISIGLYSTAAVQEKLSAVNIRSPKMSADSVYVQVN